MTQSTLIAFAVCFVGGPVLCALLLRLPGTVWALLTLAVCVVLSVTTALSYRLAGTEGHLTSLVLLWLSWVLALRSKIDNPTFRRWTLILALLATTLPWFGLATAQLMV